MTLRGQATEHSFAVCRSITRRAGSSFPFAFRLLGPPKRRAMHSLYAFARLTDDIADEPGEPSRKRAQLGLWRAMLHEALAGEFANPIHPALIDTVKRYDLPPQLLFDLIDGVEMDLDPIRFASFEELNRYCYRVASAVGLACVRIWGARPGVAIESLVAPAEAAGLAFQLTNILRDLDEDAARGRDYLPEEDRSRFPDRLELMKFEIVRAREHYLRAAELDALLSKEGRSIFSVMCGTYRALLEKIDRQAYSGPGSPRVSVSRWRKGVLFLRAWPVKWGWL